MPSVPLLAHLVPDVRLSLTVDALHSAVGAISQHSVDNQTRPLPFLFRQLKPAECR